MPIMITPEGRAVDVPDEQVKSRLDVGFTLQTPEIEGARLEQEAFDERHSGITDKVAAGFAAFARGATMGGSDLLVRGFGSKGDVRELGELREAHPTLSAGLEVAGGLVGLGKASGGGTGAAIARATPAAAVGRASARLARTEPGAGLAAKLVAGAKGGAAEGSLFGAGQGVSELSLSNEPITMERAASVLSSRMLYGAGIGGAAGTVAKAAEVGLQKANTALRSYAERARAAEGVADDLARLNAKELRAAEMAEIGTIKANRIPQKAEVADEIAAFRREMKEQKTWLATEGAEETAVRALGKRTFDADRQLDKLLQNPKYLASKPETAMAALQKQEAAIEEILAKHGDKLRASFTTDGTRVAALDAMPVALERNRALQAKITNLTGDVASPRLAEIRDAQATLASGGAKKSLGQQMASGMAFSTVAGMVAALPIPGAGLLAPILGAGAANAVTGRVFGRLGRAAAETSARSARAIDSFLDVTKRLTPAAPVLATRVLSSVRFAPEKQQTTETTEPAAPATSRPRLQDLFHERASEIASQIMTVDGRPKMRMPARLAMASQLGALRTVDPIAADYIETVAARRLEFLASKIPKRPVFAGELPTGPDSWAPSDMEMRAFARYVAAVEDPGGIEERLAAGTITTEDAEVMRTVYPERYAEIRRMILERLPTLQSHLPFTKRLALSIFSGIAVDRSMEPRIMRVLQAQYVTEPETNGGTQAPKPQPQFGSVRRLAENEFTPAQERAL